MKACLPQPRKVGETGFRGWAGPVRGDTRRQRRAGLIGMLFLRPESEIERFAAARMVS
jgi:hypothetical protein